MKRFVWPRTSLCAAASLLVALGAGPVQAADAEESTLSLKIANALRSDRLFVRAGAIFVKIKTKSGETKDITGPVVTLKELENVGQKNASSYPAIDMSFSPALLAADGNDPADFPPEVVREIMFSKADDAEGLYNTIAGIPALTRYMKANNIDGLGTPPGITGVASPETGTAGISLGFFLDDEYKWMVETYVLAAPLSTSVRIKGMTTPPLSNTPRPILIDNQKILTSKLLPPSVILGRYWGDKTWMVRPFTGAMGMYAIFYDTKATDTLNNYVGGSNPGDTTVSIKNTFGLGPVLGAKLQINDAWHASLNVGHIKLKTKATLTTRNTLITSKSQILQDLGGVYEPIRTGETVYAPGNNCSVNPVFCEFVARNGGLTTVIMKAVAGDRGQANLGTYVRETETTLTNTIFMMSVGRTF